MQTIRGSLEDPNMLSSGISHLIWKTADSQETDIRAKHIIGSWSKDESILFYDFRE